MDPSILIFDSPLEAAQACGAATFKLLEESRRANGRAVFAVSGGSTPRVMFEWMAKQDFDWSAVHIFWVDERCVPPDDSQSNYRMTRESLLDHIRIPAAQVHRIKGELPPAEALRLYLAEIIDVLGETPVFDLIQRGMGPDMHTASLFPGEPLIDDRSHIAGEVWVEKFKQHRVTLLRGVLESARATFNLATGPDKAEPLKEVLQGALDPMHKPAQIVSAGTVWYVDTAAAAKL
ncbi:MAG TPA: 6-phosphogluconolactonase [Bryobacteraceae bacterium]|jgi:6-phosphogluconolactonase|nr:6-phosphogluconolactonase [Bryobacteraceae bacterium]